MMPPTGKKKPNARVARTAWATIMVRPRSAWSPEKPPRLLPPLLLLLLLLYGVLEYVLESEPELELELELPPKLV
jgi:hypothetical protein